MLSCNDVSGVIVTKGDRDISTVVKSLPFSDVVVWDNSKRNDLKVFGRFHAAVIEAKNPIVYVQDDDCIVDIPKLLEHYDPNMVVCNMPANRRKDYQNTGISLIGWGALFHVSKINFKRYTACFPVDELFYRECDRVFTYINDCKLVDVPMVQLEYAFGEDRMGREARHGADYNIIRQRLALLGKD